MRRNRIRFLQIPDDMIERKLQFKEME